jgi:prepilin-type N-terminal cleavage/methylation domain-containing protein
MKNVKGFTLIEVMVAVLIMGVSVVTLMSLQGVLTRGVFSAHSVLERLPYIRNFFVEADKEGWYKNETVQKKSLEDPEMKLTYNTSRAKFKALMKFEHLRIEKVAAQWPSLFNAKRETAAALRFFPQK